MSKIQLSDHFSYKRLIRFVLPSIGMMVFTSLYGMVDGYFVSNYTGKEPFAAINLVFPFLMILSTIGFMFGSGGSAIVSKTMGEGKMKKAEKYFSQLIYAGLISGLLLGLLGILLLKPVSYFLGATDSNVDYCVLYGTIYLLAMPLNTLQFIFQSFTVTAERPRLGLVTTLIAGFGNMFGDYFFVAVFKWGLAGAAAATSMSMMLGGVIPLIYFANKNNSSKLRLVKTGFDVRMLLKACSNGLSELMTNISMSVVSVVYNWELLKYAGANGVAAYGVIMYAGFIFIAIFVGYSIGMAPIVGFNYGANNHEELHNVHMKSLKMIGVTGVFMLILSYLLAPALANFYVGYDAELYEMTKTAFRIYNLSCLVMGFNIYASAFFTALSNGIVSATISFARTFFFQLLAVVALSALFGITGIWFAIVVAEGLCLLVSGFFFIRLRSRYHY